MYGKGSVDPFDGYEETNRDILANSSSAPDDPTMSIGTVVSAKMQRLSDGEGTG
jgi:hypothetical protein